MSQVVETNKLPSRTTVGAKNPSWSAWSRRLTHDGDIPSTLIAAMSPKAPTDCGIPATRSPIVMTTELVSAHGTATFEPRLVIKTRNESPSVVCAGAKPQFAPFVSSLSLRLFGKCGTI